MPLSPLLQLAAPYRRALIALAFLTIASSLVVLVIPWLAARLVGGITVAEASIARLVILLLGALALLALLNFAVGLVSANTAARLLADLRVRIYAHLQLLPIGFHENHRQGDLLALTTIEVARLGNFLTGTLVSLPARLLTVAGAVVLMFRIDARLALLVPLLVPAFYLLLKLIGRRLRGLAVQSQRAEAEVVASTEENLEMLPAIKAFAREDLEIARIRSSVERAMHLRIEEGRIYAALEPAIGLLAASAAVLLLYVAGNHVRSGALTATELFGFLFYAALLTRPVGALAHTYGQVQTARGTLERLQTVLATAIEPGYVDGPRLPATRGHIAFAGVGFAYPGRDSTLDDVTFEIGAGEIVALVGSNGAGKTSLVTLLLRLHDPDRGTICLDGRDIATLDVRQLRGAIGYVPQRALLFNGTIRANIAFGLEGATDAEVEQAARLSQALGFIAELPQGLATEIGDHGVRLSGGQRQRIALARALVKDPPILVLDEATSMYDDEGENAFIAACATALHGRTVILITHRLASLAIADRIFSVEQGTVREIAKPPSSGERAAR
jgi:ATP-binding cassette subfamily B protein/subfamily B ATP-binding cassette protein MsbA